MMFVVPLGRPVIVSVLAGVGLFVLAAPGSAGGYAEAGGSAEASAAFLLTPAPAFAGPGLTPRVFPGVGAGPVVPPSASSAQPATLALASPSSELVAGIQRQLKEQGFDPGPVDGKLGPKTRRAIRAYQRAADLKVDGRPSPELLERLLLAGEEPPQAVPEPSPTPPPIETPRVEAPVESLTYTPPEAPPVSAEAETREAESAVAPPDPLANGEWHFVDSNGAEFSLTLEADGAVGGVLYDRFWRWERDGDEIVITYDNGLGVRVVRRGTISDPGTMSGEARDSRGHEWTWTAERVP